MKKIQQTTIEIKTEYASEFQAELGTMLETLLRVWRTSTEMKHKKNKVSIKINGKELERSPLFN